MIELLGENDIELPILYSEHLTGDGQQMFEHAAKLKWEGIISKNAGALSLAFSLCLSKGSFSLPLIPIDSLIAWRIAIWRLRASPTRSPVVRLAVHLKASLSSGPRCSECLCVP